MLLTFTNSKNKIKETDLSRKMNSKMIHIKKRYRKRNK
jgi:hypothetical protein